MWAMPKEDDIVSSNGASANGALPDVFIDEADRLEVEAQRVAFRELREELAAQGVDSSAEYAKVLAKAANWSSTSPS